MTGAIASEYCKITRKFYGAKYGGHRIGVTKDDSEQQARTGPGHKTRSLDQFYYHSLSGNDIKGRDENQVVTRYLIGGKNGDGVDRSRPWWPILGVDQLWLWVIDDGKLTS